MSQSRDDEVFSQYWLSLVTSGLLFVCVMLVMFAAMGFGYWIGLLDAGWAVCPTILR